MSETVPIIVTGGTPYWGRCSSQALRMAQAFHRLGHPVLYIECGGDPEPFRAMRRERGLPGGSVEDPERPNLSVMRASRLPMVPLSFPNFARRWNCKRTSRRAARVIDDNGWEDVLVFHYGWYFPELLKGADVNARHIYECLDDHTAAPNIAGKRWAHAYIRRVERQMLERAELAVYSSPDLAKRHGAERSAVVPLGVEAEHFGREPRSDPHDALGIGRPRIGFLGLVTPREDWAMVRAAAEKTPDWHWIVVGPRQGVEPRGPANLHWIGAVDYADVPDWTRNWDAGMVPLTMSDFNVRAWPLKFYEYLASRLPVVSTPIPAASAVGEEAPGLISVAGDASADAFIDAARRAIETPPALRDEALKVAAAHTWAARAGRILDMLSA
jgi:glycosyltransferase involved in cell wall biosynthesis